MRHDLPLPCLGLAWLCLVGGPGVGEARDEPPPLEGPRLDVGDPGSPGPAPAAAPIGAAGDVGRPEGAQARGAGLRHEALAEAGSRPPGPAEPIAGSPPPPVAEAPRYEEAPSPEARWIAGYWGWDPAWEDFTWVPGVWQVPPAGRTWVDGAWKRGERGWARVPGRWVDRRTARVDWRKEGPPSDHPADDPKPAPGPGYFYVPGQYAPRGEELVWKPGFWAKAQPGWRWISGSWALGAGGWSYSEGRWESASGGPVASSPRSSTGPVPTTMTIPSGGIPPRGGQGGLSSVSGADLPPALEPPLSTTAPAVGSPAPGDLSAPAGADPGAPPPTLLDWADQLAGQSELFYQRWWRRLASRVQAVSRGRVGPNVQLVIDMGQTCDQIRRSIPGLAVAPLDFPMGVVPADRPLRTINGVPIPLPPRSLPGRILQQLGVAR
jgi:hypothetical protein